MNKLEKYIYECLEDKIYLKRLIVNCYQRLFSIVPVNKIKTEYEIVVREGFFFGFHDKCPWSYDNELLLTHKILDKEAKHRKPGNEIEVGYFSGENHTNYTMIGATKSWNWQQGAMLQWVGSSKRIAFNDYNGECNYTRILSIDGKEILTLERPVGAISPDGNFALSYSFERLRKGMPGYEYLSGIEKEEKMEIPSNDGLYIIDLSIQKISRLFSIKDIVNYDYLSDFKDSYHFFSHCIFSPTNKRILFLHRWLKKNNFLESRMISCDLNGKDIFIFPTNGMVSHICWMDNNRIIAYANTLKYGRNYYLFTDKNKDYSIIGENLLTSDGHPQVSFDKRYMITDTYPDRFRRQYLKLYDLHKDNVYDLAVLRIPLLYRDEYRCDFHPRWDRIAKTISFDSAHTGIRSSCTIKLDLLS